MTENGENDQPRRSEPEGDDGNLPVIVAIGASAGGVQALQNFFSDVPDNTGAAFVVVVHLDPQRRSWPARPHH